MEKINKQDLELVQGGKYWSHISDSPYPPQSEFPTGAEDGDTC